jgi:hypothetical protein
MEGVTMAKRWWVGVAAGVALGLGSLVAVEAATDDASAQRGFTVTPAQLKINQRISQAAVRRSNEGLRLLDPIRSERGQPNKVLGWRTQDLRDGAVTTAKLNNGAVTNPKLGAGAVAEANLAGAVTARLHTVYRAAVFNTPGQEPSLEPQSEGVTSVARTTGLPTGAFDLTFAQPVEGCTFTASVGTVRPGAVTPVFAPFIPYPTLIGGNQLRVFTFNTANTLADAPFVVTVTCD